MRSPFPGMDPFLEVCEWEDFHASWNLVIKERIIPLLEPRYTARVEKRVYVENLETSSAWPRRADVAILGDRESQTVFATPNTPIAAAPVECLLPMPVEHRETYLVIRDVQSLEVVTLIETLSPANKRPGSVGRRQYLEKREQVLQSPSHLIEIDLLRGGSRLPVIGTLPPGDFYAIVSRATHRPRAQVFAWTMRDPLPVISIPLLTPDPDITLELGLAFQTVYERSRYDLTLDYRQPLDPPLSQQDADWIREQIAAVRSI